MLRVAFISGLFTTLAVDIWWSAPGIAKAALFKSSHHGGGLIPPQRSDVAYGFEQPVLLVGLRL